MKDFSTYVYVFFSFTSSVNCIGAWGDSVEKNLDANAKTLVGFISTHLLKEIERASKRK